MILGQIASFLYALIGQSGGMECLSLPLTGAVFVGSALISIGFSSLIRKIRWGKQGGGAG
jgi:hypothetical protein